MPVKQFIVDVLDTAYPAEPQIVVPFETDSVLFINVAGAPNGDGGFYTPSDVEITWDAVMRNPQRVLRLIERTLARCA